MLHCSPKHFWAALHAVDAKCDNCFYYMDTPKQVTTQYIRGS